MLEIGVGDEGKPIRHPGKTHILERLNNLLVVCKLICFQKTYLNVWQAEYLGFGLAFGRDGRFFLMSSSGNLELKMRENGLGIPENLYSEKA